MNIVPEFKDKKSLQEIQITGLPHYRKEIEEVYTSPTTFQQYNVEHCVVYLLIGLQLSCVNIPSSKFNWDKFVLHLIESHF